MFVTNAVKHFKWEPRGKRRLHKKPSAYEIGRCRWWNDIERAIVQPELTVALGVTAAASLLGRSVTISRARGTLIEGRGGARVVVTIHPSFILRIEDEGDKAREYDRFVADLKFCAEHLHDASAASTREADVFSRQTLPCCVCRFFWRSDGRLSLRGTAHLTEEKCPKAISI